MNRLAAVAALAVAAPFVLGAGVAVASAGAGILTPAGCTLAVPAAPGGKTAAGTRSLPGGLNAAQAGNAQIIDTAGVRLGVPAYGEVIAIATAMQESQLTNIAYGGDGSLGLFQQRPSQGWGTPAQIMNPVYASARFYARLLQVPGWQNMPLTAAAQDVQHSAYPGAYARWQPLATRLVAAFGGGITATAACTAPAAPGVTAAGTARLPPGYTLPPGTPAQVRTAIAYALAQLGKPYLFSGGPGDQITLNPRVCPAQKADVGNTSGATGVVQATLDPEQRCVAAAAILYAAAQLGKPYLWGGTGPDAFDCSGLVMMAYRAAGIAIPRTSQQQWAAGPWVSPGYEQPGDLVVFAGSDGTPQAPGHVGLVIGNGEMIEAYAAGYPIRVSTYGLPSSPGGDQVVVGFTRPS